MRFLVSLLLSIIIYISIIFIFIFFLFPKQKSQRVYIHTAIIAKRAKINKMSKKNKSVKKTIKAKIKKSSENIKKAGSKSNITHGGDIGFDDIFKNVNYNVETKKIIPKKQLEMSRLKGIERNLKKIKKISVEINFVQNNGEKLTKEEINDIISQKLYKIWYDISTIPTDYAKINIQNLNGDVIVNILDSNLPLDRQKMLINEIKKIKFDKNFNITVLFQSKVNND